MHNVAQIMGCFHGLLIVSTGERKDLFIISHIFTKKKIKHSTTAKSIIFRGEYKNQASDGCINPISTTEQGDYIIAFRGLVTKPHFTIKYS